MLIHFSQISIYTKQIKEYSEEDTDKNNEKVVGLKGDSSKLKSIGWNPKYEFTDTIKQIINHYNTL